MSKHAIIIFYDGSKPSEGTIADLHYALSKSGIVRDQMSVEMHEMTEEEIIAAVAAKAVVDGRLVQHTALSAEQEAVVFIAERFKNEIASGDMSRLEMAMDIAALTSKYRIEDVKLNRSLCLLASHGILEHLSFDKKKDATLWKNIIEIIRRVYARVYV